MTQEELVNYFTKYKNRSLDGLILSLSLQDLFEMFEAILENNRKDKLQGSFYSSDEQYKKIVSQQVKEQLATLDLDKIPPCEHLRELSSVGINEACNVVCVKCGHQPPTYEQAVNTDTEEEEKEELKLEFNIGDLVEYKIKSTGELKKGTITYITSFIRESLISLDNDEIATYDSIIRKIKPEPELVIEVGKFYEARDGIKTFINHCRDDTRCYCTGVRIGEAGTRCYTKDGEHCSENSYDLIKEWRD